MLYRTRKFNSRDRRLRSLINWERALGSFVAGSRDISMSWLRSCFLFCCACRWLNTPSYYLRHLLSGYLSGRAAGRHLGGHSGHGALCAAGRLFSASACWEFRNQPTSDIVGLAIFCISGVSASVVVELYRRRREKLAASAIRRGRLSGFIGNERTCSSVWRERAGVELSRPRDDGDSPRPAARRERRT